MPDGLRARAVDLAYASGWGAVKLLPEPVARRGFAAAADYASVRNGSGARQLRRNLRRVVGPRVSERRLDELVAEGLRNYARYWQETFRLPRMDHAEVLTRVHTENPDRLEELTAPGRGLIAALPHMGNWDIAGLWLADRGYPFTTVAERLKPESLFDRFVAYRQSLGMEVVPLQGGERTPAAVLGERLRAGGMVCLVADRDLSAHGIEVDFFGEKTRMPAGPALLSATTGAPLITAGLWFTENGWGQHIDAPVDLGTGSLRERVQRGTQALADRFAGYIADRPTDWHMLQKLWLDDLTPRAPRPDAET